MPGRKTGAENRSDRHYRVRRNRLRDPRLDGALGGDRSRGQTGERIGDQSGTAVADRRAVGTFSCLLGGSRVFDGDRSNGS